MNKYLKALVCFSLMICMINNVKADLGYKKQDCLVEGSEYIDDQVLEIIDQYVSMNDDELFYITNDKELKSLVSKQQYKVICNQIKARNNEVKNNKDKESNKNEMISLLSTEPLGTSGNPYVFSLGTTITKALAIIFGLKLLFPEHLIIELIVQKLLHSMFIKNHCLV